MPSGSARIRLAVDGEGEWDAVIDVGAIELQPAERRPARRAAERRRCNLGADRARRARWDGRLPRGPLSVRQNLHLGVGFLAATSGIADERRLRFESVRTRRRQDLDPLSGRGRSGDLRARARRDQGLLPAHRRRAGRPPSGDRDRPARVRRFRQAARRPLRRALLRRRVVALLDELGDRARPPDRQQHGRAGGDRDGAAATRAHREDRPAQPGARLVAQTAAGAGCCRHRSPCSA